MPRGTCQCGRVSVDAGEIAPLGLHCYCSICRKIAGAPFSSVVLVPRRALAITCAEGAISGHASSPNFVRHHCAACHGPIHGDVTDRPDLAFFVSATLFDAAALAHVRFEHIFVGSKVAWYAIQDGAPQHQEQLPDAVMVAIAGAAAP